MARRKKIAVKVTRSEWDRAKMPRFGLAVSATLTDVGKAKGKSDESTLHNLRGGIRREIEQTLRFEVDLINLVLVEENPPEGI